MMIIIFDIAGNWTVALLRVVESVYSFFIYDVATYIAGNLEIEEGGHEEENEQDTVRKMEGGGGEGGAEQSKVVKEEVGERENEQEDEDDDEETDDAMSGLEYDTSTEEDAFEDSKSPERPVNSTSHTPVPDLEKSERLDQRHPGSSPGNNHRVHSSSSSGSNNKPVNSPSHPSNDSSGAHSGCSANSTNKTISSFTVENILMGNTSRSNSTSSGSPTSASHLANNTFLPFPPTTQAMSGLGSGVSHGSSSTPASPASANWTSHPPVKYTKFTMMSPSSMRIGGDKRRKGERDKTVTTTTTATSDGNHHKLQAPPIPEEVAHQASRCKEEPKSPAPHSGSVHLFTAAPSSHLTYHHSVIQSAVPSSSTVASLSRQNSSQSASGAAVASPRLIPVSPNPFSRVQTQSPHHPQQQHYVVFFPPNVALMTAPTGELQVIGQNSPQLYIQGAALHQANGNHVHKKTSSPHLSSSSPSPPPNPNSSSSILSSSNNLRLFRTSSNPSFTSTNKLSEPSHFLSRTTTSTSVEKSQATMMHKLGSKSLVAAGGEKAEGGGRGMPKQKKLRFHMTTVVRKERRRSSSVSLTAPPPTLCNRPPQPDTRQGPHAGSAAQIESKNNNRVERTSSATTSSTKKGAEVSNHTNAESSLHNSDSTSSTEEAASRPPHSDSQTDISSTNAQNSPKQKDPTKFENHLSLPLSQSSSASSIESFTGHLPSEQITSNSRGRGRGRGRRSRGYTRRKRELTFHLYEDPYRAKRSRQQN